MKLGMTCAATVQMIVGTVLGCGNAWAAATETTVFQFGSLSNEYGPVTPIGGVALSNFQGKVDLAGVSLAGGRYGFGTVYTLDLSKQDLVPFTSSFATTQVSGEEPEYANISQIGMYPQIQFLAVISTGGTYHNGSLVEPQPTMPNDQPPSVVYNFQGNTDGNKPRGPVTPLGPGGYFYGTANYGGAGYGVIYAVQGTTESVVHTFNGSDGAYPTGGVLIDASGNFFCTTRAGGAYGYGAVFKESTAGSSVLYSFKGGSDGATPVAGLIEDSAGNLYGTTVYGGTGAGQGNGTVFKIAPDGTKTTLHNMDKHTGVHPAGNLVLSPAGDLYGVTNQTGNKPDAGEVFEISASGVGSIVHKFTTVDGYGPNPELASTLSQNVLTIFGATAAGGDGNEGVIFKVTVTP